MYAYMSAWIYTSRHPYTNIHMLNACRLQTCIHSKTRHAYHIYKDEKEREDHNILINTPWKCENQNKNKVPAVRDTVGGKLTGTFAVAGSVSWAANEVTSIRKTKKGGT